MRKKQSKADTKAEIKKAFFRRIPKPNSLDRFGHSYLIPKFAWAFLK